MLPDQILKEAAAVEPGLVAKIAVALSMIEEQCPEFLEDTASEMNEVVHQSNAKLASASPQAIAAARTWGAAKLVGGAAASALATTIASDLYDAAKRGLTKGTNLNRIMEMNPQLKSYDKSDVKKAFNSLHKFAPEFTSDPNLGGQILHRLVELPNDQHNLIRELISSRKNIRDIRRSQFAMEPVDMFRIHDSNSIDLEAAKLLMQARSHKEKVDYEMKERAAERERADNLSRAKKS